MSKIPFFDSVGSPLLILFFVLLLIMQWRRPLRRLHVKLLRRLVRNIGFALPAFVTFRLVLLPIPLLAAHWAHDHQVGLLNWLLPHTGIRGWVGGILGFLAFDYAYYWWHYATHKVPLLWRFHNVHHTDLDMDVSTAVRFHFGELLLSVLFRVALVGVLGISFWSAIVYEVFFDTAAQFHHANWRLPARVERLLNTLFVTPRMHGIHHSIVRDEFNSNWGTLFSVWDRLHKTHRMDIAQEDVTLGVPAYRDENELKLGHLFRMPFGKQRDWKLPNGTVPVRQTNINTATEE
ncbi:sterol desaturase family protein [Spirosoma pollinicola]|uniref:Fatty acid hydroxylase n=1 Tax=Spirosoma pollinicola TaxID=2057025 RepID=A0A2K8Z6I9_9BACT|nr:sterol desaturase family protein [Spirosoma pollinicola]AUD05439.1 fatty acid hydroxylase [Spirosoma pollinicola]RZM30518.1 MAG: sterol desaturase family protein [Pedobacter sp.]